MRKINPHFTNAISKDVADQGNALAERVDAKVEPPASTAQTVAKLILMSSLSMAKDPLRGLRENEIVEYVVDPLVKVSEIKNSINELSGQGWYLFRGPDERIYFGQTANVTAEINDTAASLAEEVVDAELRGVIHEGKSRHRINRRAVDLVGHVGSVAPARVAGELDV